MSTLDPEDAPIPSTGDNDRDLVLACLRGDESAWQVLVDEFTPWVRGVIKHVLGKWAVPYQSHDVDDICANVFTELVARDRATLRSFSEPYNLKAWLAVIARRMCVRSRRGSHLPSTPLKEASTSVAPGSIEPEESSDERRSLLEDLLGSLEPEDRTIVELYYVQERTHEEISAILDIPTNTLRKRKSRIVAELRSSPQFDRLRELFS